MFEPTISFLSHYTTCSLSVFLLAYLSCMASHVGLDCTKSEMQPEIQDKYRQQLNDSSIGVRSGKYRGRYLMIHPTYVALVLVS
ncbi:hypothetical protein EDC04DRAFT_2710533 [Pisolithus marmoratus]|nr:hypothetical protein EDC04DRAFT_2710533 [Pisolithus marmoratus]